MKKIILPSLLAVTMLASCQNNDKATAEKSDTAAVATSSLAEPETKSSDSTAKVVADASSKVYEVTSLQTQPTYPGGIEKFYAFLWQNIKYPPAAIKQKVQGNVNLGFIIEKDGSISDIKVERSLGSGTDEEAIRVLKSGKKWNPGVMDGKPVRTYYRIPIKFSLAS